MSNNVETNPFTLLGVTKDSSEKEVRRAYHRLIRGLHSDKRKDKDAAKEELAKRVTQAYNALKEADDDAKEKFASTAPNNTVKVSNCLVDKSISERFRRLFAANLEASQNINFRDNFCSFYSDVFAAVELPKSVDLKMFYCQICFQGHHAERCPFSDQFTSYLGFFGDQDGFMPYLKNLFGDDLDFMEAEVAIEADEFSSTGEVTNEFLMVKGQLYMEKKNRLKALKYLLPLLKCCLTEGNGQLALETLRVMLPRTKFVNSVKLLVTERPKMVGNCVALATLFFEEMETSLDILKRIDMLMEATGAVIGVPWEKFNVKNCVIGFPIALHVLHQDSVQNTAGYIKYSNLLWNDWIPLLLKHLVYQGDFLLAIKLATFSKSAVVVLEFLTKNRIIGQEKIRIQKGIKFHGKMLVLKGISHFHRGEIAQMVTSFENAVLNVPQDLDIKNGVAQFLTSDASIHEQILAHVCVQYEWLRSLSFCGTEVSDKELLTKCSTIFCHTEPVVGIYAQSYGLPEMSDIVSYEKDILGREDSNGDQNRNQTFYAEQGYSYLDLALITESIAPHIACFVMAANSFVKAMTQAPQNDIPRQFAYRAIIQEAMDNLGGFNLHNCPPEIMQYILRCRLTFQYQADRRFSQILTKRKVFEQGILQHFIDISGNAAETATSMFQQIVNLRKLSPLSDCSIYTVYDTVLVEAAYCKWLNAFLIARCEQAQQESLNCPQFLFKHFLFNAVWKERSEIPNLEEFEPMETEVDPNQTAQKRPVQDSAFFQHTREGSISALAATRGYDPLEIEHMMCWTPLRRDEFGFLDTHDRSLDFGGKAVYTRFAGVRIDANSGFYEWLLEPAVAGDPKRPAMFTAADIAEILECEIDSAFISFDECSNKWMAPHDRLTLPYHPFFDVNFGPANICGTNYLMTLYHLDLLAKVLTTGQEMSAHYPFEFCSSERLLDGLPKTVREILQPIGPRKTVRRLKPYEHINRFWFQIENVESNMIHGSSNVTSFVYGDAEVTLNTQLMLRDPNTLETKDAENNENSPEKEFVRGFNSNMAAMEEIFPLLRRVKELAKISAACEQLIANRAALCDATKFTHASKFKAMFDTKYLIGQRKPYSNCVYEKLIGSETKKRCNCCNWVPAAFHEMKVTDEQKLEFLFGNRFGRGGLNAVTGEALPKLTFGNGTGSFEKEAGGKDENKKNGNQESRSSGTIQWNMMEHYKVYGGVLMRGNVKQVPRLTSGGNHVSVRGNSLPTAPAGGGSRGGGSCGGNGGNGGDDGNDKFRKFRLPLETPGGKQQFPFKPPVDKSGQPVLKKVNVSGTGGKKGYLDADGNIWTKGRAIDSNKKIGQHFEWDVQLKRGGGKHVNVDWNGNISH